MADESSNSGSSEVSRKSEDELTEDRDIPNDKLKASMFKERGNTFFKRGDYDEAINSYTTAISADFTNPMLFGNRAIAFLKKADTIKAKAKLARTDPLPQDIVEIFKAADKDCNQALRLDRTYVKAHFRRGQARRALGMLKEALFDFESVLKFDPANELANKELQAVKVELWAQSGKPPSQKRQFTEHKLLPVVAVPTPENWEGELKRIKIEDVNVREDVTPDEAMHIEVNVTAPPPAKSSFQFYADWASLERHDNVRLQYLRAVGSKGIEKVFSSTIEPEVFSDILKLLAELGTASVERVEVLELMEAISKVGRFDTMRMFMDDVEVKRVTLLLKEADKKLRDTWKV